ncbi:hypothetical protein EXE46_02560 [Halorubrum sp. GN11_10-6_MGM]|uniref:hypothetical protein n=1 Tax=Halorubrum sp. GN11_10-6_MGM TaxID=2518112 RepID=UPI0010FA1996|nr:hypothetical protein [Halorubrum sp. GN11_10-6_MGM]TKX75648.1 hypothetical protein EXE46_02560 [Halorubrum sp. GN11_10-6_MGM]
MTASNPIPLDEFATAVASLDRDALATLVGEAYAATADGVTVDPPRVTVRKGARRTDLLVRSTTDCVDPVDGVDAVVVASDALLDDLPADLDADVVTPGDLRQRLLYAVPSAEANAIADRTLGVPVRSATYDGAVDSDADGEADSDESNDDAAADGEATDADGPTDSDESDVDAAADSDEADVPAAAGAFASGVTGGSVASGTADRTAGSDENSRPLDRSTAAADASRPTDAADAGLPTDAADANRPSGGAPSADAGGSGAPSDRRSPRTVLAAVAVAALLVAAAGAGFVAGTAGIGGPDGVAGVGDDEPSDPSATDSDAAGSTDGGGDGSEESGGDGDDATTVAVAAGDPTGEAARNTALSPTCDRSALQVVQIQMNALRYNDDETNDGIRTLRAFASPENRDVVGSIGQYVELFETPRYAPMLTYDTAQYSVPVIADGTAEVAVVTRENGSVTGRYEFRLVRVGGGTGATDGSLGDVDDCWMTDAVAASIE